MMTWTRRRWLTASAAGAAAASLPPIAGAASRDAPPLPPPLPAEVFRERQVKLKAAAKARGLDAVFVTPSTNLAYISNLSMGRSERLTALILFSDGPSVLVTPSFEEGVVRREAAVDDVKTWKEEEDPVSLAAKTLAKTGRIGIEGSTAYSTVARVSDAVAGARLEDATPLFDALRMVKSEQEMALLRDAGDRAVAAIGATHRRLRKEMTEREVSRILDEEFGKLGVRGGGLVQFGPSAALPHGSPGDRRLARGDVVLIDAGCRVRGYTSDVTRTVCFGPPSEEVRKVYATVDRAQIAGIQALKAGATGEQVDQAARKVIEDAGYGSYFTHRLGHGLGLDGHEHPYLVKGNRTPLVPGNTVTVEPGIYLPEKFGVRIEDDYGVREGNPVTLSVRPAELTVLGG
jgi:Xaa-Pro dipeptidase